MRLTDKVVLITAATRGIGYAIVEACAREGAVVYMAARNMELAEEKCRVLQQQGYQVVPVYQDASRQETYASMVKEVIQQSGHIDVLVNNFGTSDPQQDLDIEHTEFSYFMKTMEMNLASVFLSTQAVLPYMKQQAKGSIINIASIGGVIPDVARIAYGVSKNAIIYLSKNIALQEARSGIRVNVVCPGQTATDAVKNHMPPEFQEIFAYHTPIQRMGKPEEIADAVLYFAGDGAAYTTGQVISISGGFGLGTPIYADLMKDKGQKNET